MTPQDVLSEAVVSTKALVGRYLAGFDDSTCTRQATNLPNHVAWCLGHLALTMHRVAEKITNQPPPARDFTNATGGTGVSPVSSAFNTESVAFGSQPADDPAAYPSLARGTEIFNSACDRLGATVKADTEAQLNQTIKWGPVEGPWWLFVLRMTFHNGIHAGQIADLRRALGFKSIFA